jgi:hypothetical protein
VKTRFPDKTDASILLEPDTAYDTLVQVMDRVRVFETGEGANTAQAELFPDISIGDAPAADAAAPNATPAAGTGAPAGAAPVAGASAAAAAPSGVHP